MARGTSKANMNVWKLLSDNNVGDLKTIVSDRKYLAAVFEQPCGPTLLTPLHFGCMADSEEAITLLLEHRQVRPKQKRAHPVSHDLALIYLMR